MVELRMTKDIENYNPAMYVITIYSPKGGIEETISENIFNKVDLLKMWQSWKEN